MEEDIKILEGLVKGIYKYGFDYDVDGEKHDIIRYEEFKALENLIKGYRELESEVKRVNNTISTNIVRELNTIHKSEIKSKEDLQALYDGFQIEIKKDYIPKSKIKEKIEEWDKSIKWNNADDRYYAIRILQELVEDK